MEPIRVLILVSSFAVEGPLGGVARFAVELSRALDKRRITPILGALWDYHTESDQRWLAQLRAEGFRAFIAADRDEQAPYQSCVAALRGLWRLAPCPVEIIHSHGEFNDLAALAIRRHVRARALVRTVHNEIEWAKRPLFGKIFPGLLYPLTFDAELGVAQKVVDNMDQRRLARSLHKRGVRVYNALNFARFANQAVDQDSDGAAKRLRLGLPIDAPVIGTVGRLVPQKGHAVLLAAAAQVLQQQPNAHFLVVGAGRLADDLHAQADILGIAANVHFLGPRTDVEELYGVMDCFVSSSLWEGLPTVIMESMAAGVPVVATRVAGNLELVTHEETGILAAPNDPHALAIGILTVINNPSLAQEMAGRAASAARARFSIEAVAQQQAEIYAQLLAHR